jgi:hypothetical protein
MGPCGDLTHWPLNRQRRIYKLNGSGWMRPVVPRGLWGFLLQWIRGDGQSRGDLIFKPREQWHTFWNAGHPPARVVEVISPAGFEN